MANPRCWRVGDVENGWILAYYAGGDSVVAVCPKCLELVYVATRARLKKRAHCYRCHRKGTDAPWTVRRKRRERDPLEGVSHLPLVGQIRALRKQELQDSRIAELLEMTVDEVRAMAREGK